MRIVVTGAGGTLGRVLVPRLLSLSHEVVGIDIAPGPGGGEWIQADIRDAEAVVAAAEGADLIVHAAAFHGIHLVERSARDFYELNLTGTFNVWRAAVAHGVRGVVFSSTMGVYGETRTPLSDDDVAVLDEDEPLRPTDIYGWTKLAGEELCRFHRRQDGIPSIALRYGMFVPEPFFRYGIRLLYGGVHEDDVADAVIAAIGALGSRSVGFEAYNVESPLPFTAADGHDLRTDPLVAVDRHWPGAAELLRSRGVRSMKPITEVFPMHRAEAGLGVRPRHDFAQWLEDLARRPDERAAGDPAWP